MKAVGHKIDISNKMPWVSGKDMDCTKGKVARIDNL